MGSLFKTALTVVRIKTGSLLAKVRQWTEPEFIRSVTLAKLQEFFQSLFDVKPRDKDGYYVFFSWMIGWKLASFLVLLLGLESLLLIIMFHLSQGMGSGTVRVYRYDSLPLKSHKGEVRIFAKDGHTAYVGNVEKGNAAGTGKLYGKSGELIYEEAFENSLYNREGKLYYGNGALKYSGEFKDNVHQGMGNGYWSNDSKEYPGGYEQGKKSGEGQFYDSGGNLILMRLLNADLSVYAQSLGKSTEEVGQIYSGKLSVYDSGNELCANMPQINVIHTVQDGGGSLGDAYTVNRVYVLLGNITLAGETYDEISALEEVMGEAGYQGYSNMELAEAVDATTPRERGDPDSADPQLEGSRASQEVMEASGYQANYNLYLYASTYGDLMYSFYSDEKSGCFAMYPIEHVAEQKRGDEG